MEEVLNAFLDFVDIQTDWKVNNDTTNSQVVNEFTSRFQYLVDNCVMPVCSTCNKYDACQDVVEPDNLICKIYQSNQP